jgi:hypothetical protein
MSTGDHQRTSRKKDRTSSTNNAGCSNAAKWPPLAGSFQYRMFGNRRSAHRRDGRCSYRAITRMSDSARERLRSQVVIATLRRAFVMVSSIRGFVEASC